MVLTIGGYTNWQCVACGLTKQTSMSVTNVWHPCPKMKGISVQLVRAGVKAKLEIVERQDYVGKEQVQLLGEDRRPVMSMRTIRDDGEDAVVYAPTAVARFGGN